MGKGYLLTECANELSSIINELERIENEVRYGYQNIGNVKCADSINSVIDKYKEALRTLNSVSPGKLDQLEYQRQEEIRIAREREAERKRQEEEAARKAREEAQKSEHWSDNPQASTNAQSGRWSDEVSTNTSSQQNSVNTDPLKSIVNEIGKGLSKLFGR